MLSMVGVAPALAHGRRARRRLMSTRSGQLGARVLRQGMVGRDVRMLQRYLTYAGFPTATDGDFGPQTEAHVRAFERRYHMRVNGIVNHWFVRRITLIVVNREGTKVITDASGGASFGAPPVSSTADPTTQSPLGAANTGAGAASTTTGGSSTAAPDGPPEKAHLVNGLAVAPPDAPMVIQEVIAAANRIARKPYVYGGGHASFDSYGYDCSGSVSYALHGGGLLSSPLDSTGFESYGSPGPGSWITLWTNAGHVYMQIAGLWFDTAAQSPANGNDRWSTTRINPPQGYIVRHPTGW
jgi:peptidoglycan hydrolase-like protein with peptidoglycan-binding domain